MIVFFDVDNITHEYLKKCNACSPETCVLEQNINALSNIEHEKIKNAEIFSVFIHSELTKEVLQNFPKLQLIVTRSTGYNHIDLEYCQKHGIVVENVPRYGEATVAEFAVGLCLNLTRKIGKAYSDLKRGICEIDNYMGRDLYKSILGIIGTGAIGKHAIKIALGLGMKVIAYDIKPDETLENVEYVSLEELYNRSDFISLHCPLTKDNEHMLNADTFALMKKGVIIINTARGGLINNEDLYKALKSGQVGGAGLDALEEEDAILNDDIYISKVAHIPQSELVTSFVNMKLLQLPNVIITPHIAFNSVDAIHRILDTTMDNIKAFKEGRIVNAVI